MKITDKFIIFKEWMLQKYKNVPHIGCCYHGNNDLCIITPNFPLWEESNKNKTNQELGKLFIDVVREELPQLKGTRVRFKLNKVGLSYQSRYI